jgi:hypothetical protein
MLRMTVAALACAILAAGVFSGTADAQYFQSQNNQNLGTRRGAFVGGIVGGVIGARNDRPVAGIVAGAVVGGLLGREIGRQQDTRTYQQSFHPQYGQNYYPGQNFRSTNIYQDPRYPMGPTYNIPRQNFYGPRQYQIQPQQPRVIRYGW